MKNSLSKFLASFLLVFTLYYQGKIVSTDFEMSSSSVDKLQNEVEIHVYNPVSNSKFDFQRHVDKDGFNYEFNTSDFHETFNDLTLIMYSNVKGQIHIIFRGKLNKNLG